VGKGFIGKRGALLGVSLQIKKKRAEPDLQVTESFGGGRENEGPRVLDHYKH